MSQSCSNISSTRDDELQSPKFYKDDLLRVLKERNELKEEMDSLRDELSLTQAYVEHEIFVHLAVACIQES